MSELYAPTVLSHEDTKGTKNTKREPQREETF